VHDTGEFVEVAVRAKRAHGWVAVVAFAACAGFNTWAQESGPSLGDVARTTRKEHSSASHLAAKKVATEEDDGPDLSGVWRVRPCPQTTLCYELSIVLPKSPKWTRDTNEPRPVLIPVAGHEDDPSRAIRVYAAETLAPMQSAEVAKRTFLQAWFAKPEYFGQAARITMDEHVWVDNNLGTISHFSITGAAFKYHGLSMVMGWAYGNFGFACVYRDEDAPAAASICDAIVRSAKYQVLQPAKRLVYADPQADDPPADDPVDDPPDE
jgi:hypothetical protein